MSTLLLCLAGPMQAWGTDSKFEVRGAGREPSKSGVIGLLAAALGRSRDSDLSDLNALRFGIRVEQEGVLLRDYHTVCVTEKPYVTNRYYLADACFLVGLEGETSFLEQLSDALTNPVFPLFLGRRSCPPCQPLVLGIRNKNLIAALSDEPWQASEYMQKKLRGRADNAALRIRVDAPDGSSASKIRDTAISFDPRRRRYGYRNVIELNVTASQKSSPMECYSAEHDPMEELR